MYKMWYTLQGEDLAKLEEEIVFGKEQLQLADHLLSKCNAVRKRGRERESTTDGPTRRKGGRKSKGSTRKRLLSSKK